MKKHSQIGRKALLSILMFAILICLVGSVVVGVLYRNSVMGIYRQQTLDYANTAAEFINADTVKAYLENPVQDEYYNEIYTYLNTVVNHSQLKYYYIFVPTEDDIIYLWDTDIDGGLGMHEAYQEGDKELFMAEFSATPTGKMTIAKDPIYGYIGSAYAPIYDSEGQPVALVGADISMEGIVSSQIHFLTVMVLCILGVLLVFNVIHYEYIRRSIIAPVISLNNAAENMVQHLEDGEAIRLDIHTHDEIEDLGNSFTTMQHEIQQYIKRLSAVTAEKERIGTELNVAAKIQANMLPTIFPPYPEREEFDICASMTPAKEVGGDFYDFFMLDEDHLALVIADVSGKGVPAALFMVVAKTLIKNQSSFSHSPKAILEAINNQLCENNATEMFVTTWLCVYEISTGKCVAANAGHEYPMLRKADGDFELLHDRHGFVLGGMEDSHYKEYEFQVEEGGTLFVYTDGASEATNSSNELFGEERIVEALNVKPDASPAELIANLKKGINDFVGDAPQFDDITMLSIKRNHVE